MRETGRMSQPLRSPGRAHVEPGGPHVTWTVGQVTVHKASVSEQDNNAYLLVSDDEAVLIDAADDAPVLTDLLATTGARLTSVVTTHRHWDHHRALAPLVHATGAQSLAGADDADEIPGRVDRRLGHGDVVILDGLELAVIALRGHTPGSIALVLGGADGDGDDLPHLFTGDSLFPGGVGKTRSPEEFASLLADVTERIFSVFDDAHVHPGHGDSSTLGAERPHLDAWRARGW